VNHGSLLTASVSGPEALTGGAFGPEAGLVAIVVCLIPAILFLREAKRRDRFYTRPGRQPAQTAPQR
jgi:hypothetical protein